MTPLSSTEAIYTSVFLFFISLLNCCAKKPCEDRFTDQQDIVHCPTVVLRFLEGPSYYNTRDFKHFPNSFSCSLMHSHAWRTLSSKSTGCVFIIKALLTHMITGIAHWHMPSPPGNQTLIFFFSLLHYDWNG